MKINEASNFDKRMLAKLKGNWVKRDSVLYLFSLLTKGIITKGKNNEKSINNAPKVGVKTPGTGSKPVAYTGLLTAALLALLYRSTALKKLFPMIKLVSNKKRSDVFERKISLISFPLNK